MDKKIYDNYVEILKRELLPAMGCTEPIAIAYATAKARQVLGAEPEKMIIHCSGNIIKNVMGVTVPNSGGLKGIPVAALLGAVGGNADKGLEVISQATDEHRAKVRELLEKEICTTELVEGIENLYIDAELTAGEDTVHVVIKEKHDNIVSITKNDEVLHEEAQEEPGKQTHDKSLLNLEDIYEFANTVDLKDVKELIGRQLEYNSAISEEGLNGNWGTEVGKTILETEKDSLRAEAAARAAAGSDARMSGCALPVVINSGSGNQGITITMPILTYAKALEVSEEKLYRAMVLADLIALHQKRFIGALSAYCGAVCAATAAGCGIAYLHDESLDVIADTIVNTTATIGGMVCDGAKPSCAAKIASSVNTAILGYEMAKRNHVYAPGEGIVKETVEETIESVGRMGREGMKSTDIEILNIMIGK